MTSLKLRYTCQYRNLTNHVHEAIFIIYAMNTNIYWYLEIAMLQSKIFCTVNELI